MISLIDVISDLEKGSLLMINNECCAYVNSIATQFLNEESPSEDLMKETLDVLTISNILYNNTERNLLPLEDGVYDLVVAKFNKITGGKSPVGSKPINFKKSNTVPESYQEQTRFKHTAVKLIDIDKMMFFKDISSNPVRPEAFDIPEYTGPFTKPVSNNVPHMYPELVGTLDKCKFVTISDAMNHGVDPNSPESSSVNIFERDFMLAHQRMGFDFRNMCITLKYDGVSVEADVCGDHIVSARSRGDTENEEARDLTHIFGGYVFRGAREAGIGNNVTFGIKFECILTKPMALQLKYDYDLSYKNGRTAIIGLMRDDEGRKFRDYMTLVPLASSGLGIPNREEEIMFLNAYYSSGVELKYAMISAEYSQRLYMINEFTKNAEALRPYMPFMYDGVVVEYTDPQAIQALGRQRSVNKWAVAIKFDTQVKRSILVGCEFVIGQDGVIVPMAYFNPVEFFGTIHDKTTIHSYRKFNQMDLHIGDIVSLEYRNDVIVYLYKPNIAENAVPKGEDIPFPEVCPYCGKPLSLSKSGDSVMCTNLRHCPGINFRRVVNMLKKLNFKDFGESYVKSLNIVSFTDLINKDPAMVREAIGDVMGAKFFERVNDLLKKPYPDYRVLGSIGFTGVAAESWKNILTAVSLEYVIESSDSDLYNALLSIKGVGKNTAEVITKQRKWFEEDLKTVSCLDNIQRSYGDYRSKIIVRFSGVRDENLENKLNDTGLFDASGTKGVTKKTDILVVPYIGFQSTKIDKINKHTCRLMTLPQLYESLKNISQVKN